MKTRNKEKSIRDRRSKTVSTFLSEYNPNNQLAYTNELELANKASKGDLTALSLLVNAHLKLVKAVAMHYRKQGLSTEELCFVGNIGLIKAASRFDATKSTTFRHYAIWWIRQSMLKALHEQAQIAMAPESMIQELWHISSSFNAIETASDLEPSDKEIKDLLQAKIYEIASVHSLPLRFLNN